MGRLIVDILVGSFLALLLVAAQNKRAIPIQHTSRQSGVWEITEDMYKRPREAEREFRIRRRLYRQIRNDEWRIGPGEIYFYCDSCEIYLGRVKKNMIREEKREY